MMTSKGEYSSQEVIMLTGITYRQLDYWIRMGVVTPSVDEGHGSGHSRRFNARDVFHVRVVAALLAYRVRRDTVGAVIAHIAQREDIADYPVVHIHQTGWSLNSLEQAKTLLAMHKSGIFISVKHLAVRE
jgi:DNA-binding transcriptional MerR regulator